MISYYRFSFTINALTSEDFHVIFDSPCNIISGFGGIVGVVGVGIGLSRLEKSDMFRVCGLG